MGGGGGDITVNYPYKIYGPRHRSSKINKVELAIELQLP